MRPFFSPASSAPAATGATTAIAALALALGACGKAPSWPVRELAPSPVPRQSAEAVDRCRQTLTARGDLRPEVATPADPTNFGERQPRDVFGRRVPDQPACLRRFEEDGPPEAPPVVQDIKVRLRGGRTGVQAVIAKGLAIESLTKPFDLEIEFGDRVAILGGNGTGKSHFLRLLAGDSSVHVQGNWRLGSRVVAGFFAQTHAHPEFIGKTLVQILWENHSLTLAGAMGALRRYELNGQGEQAFETLSGGQQARFQVLLLELGGATLLLLDEPTDNLDLASAEALEMGLSAFEGTVIAVTHDRWFSRGFDRFVVFGRDQRVYESPEPIWEKW